MALVEMTTRQYADYIGICEGAVRKAVKMGHRLRDVEKRTKFGKSHVFHVAVKRTKKNRK